MDKFVLELPDAPDALDVLQTLEETFIRMGGESEYLEGMKMVVPGAGKLYGVKVPILRRLSKEILRKYNGEKEAIKKLAEECWFRGSREHQLVALFMLAGTRVSSKDRWALGVKFLADLNNWESCDQLCMALLGQALAEDARYMDVLETWLHDESVWVRRAALVSTVYLRRSNFPTELGEELDRRTLAMASVLLDDKENYIRKAVDWTVREVIKRHYRMGQEWLMTWACSKPSKIAKSTLRLISKKLTAQDQEAFLSKLGA